MRVRVRGLVRGFGVKGYLQLTAVASVNTFRFLGVFMAADLDRQHHACPQEVPTQTKLPEAPVKQPVSLAAADGLWFIQRESDYLLSSYCLGAALRQTGNTLLPP